MTSNPPTFGGRYLLIERIGTGGMAEVYRGRDELLGREVAIKVLSDRFSRDRSFVERFRREAQAAANLNHHNIVSLYDYGADHGTSRRLVELERDVLAHHARLAEATRLHPLAAG